jgi:hypothetical protein
MRTILLISCAILSSFLSQAQTDTSFKKIVIPDIQLSDTVFPGYTLEPVTVYNWKLPKDIDLNTRDQAYLKKVYPYALRISHLVNQIESDLFSLESNKKRRKYKSEMEDILKDQFEDDVRNLTRIQGQMLTKLVYRETGYTIYELLKKYKGGFSAGWWNLLGKFYDQDLKLQYDPSGVDLQMEKYVQYLDLVYLRNGFKETIQNERYITPVQSEKRKRKGS